MSILKTPSGIRFGLLGKKGASPAPTLFMMGGRIEDMLEHKDYNESTLILRKHGYLCVSLDAPSHGQDIRKDEKEGGLMGWIMRLKKGDDFVADSIKKTSALLDYLIKNRYTDPKRIAIVGISRGGFLGLHFAACDPRVKCLAALAPVPDLLALREFAGMKNHAGTKALDLIHIAKKLAGRPIWICIGTNDDRVDTDRAFAFVRKIAKEASPRANRRTSKFT